MSNSAKTAVKQDAWKLYDALALSYFLIWGFASLAFQGFVCMRSSSDSGGLAFLFLPLFEVLAGVVFALPIIGITVALIGFRSRSLLWLAGLSVVKLLLATSGWLNALDLLVSAAFVAIPIACFVPATNRKYALSRFRSER